MVHINVMGKPKLALQIPAHHTISIPANGVSECFLHGTLSLNNVPPQCETRITLARIGRLKTSSRGRETQNDSASKKFLGEFGFLGSQKEQEQELFDCKIAEKLSSCSVQSQPRRTATSNIIECGFELQIPEYLPATAELPSFSITYAISAICILPNGKVLQAVKDLRITREAEKAPRLEPSRTVSFPETTFAVRAIFGLPSFDLKKTSIPTTLRLNSLSLPIANSMRITETRWLVPREIRWSLEETAILITGCPDATGHLPMSTAHRVSKKRQIATGKQKLKLKYPFTRAGNTPVTMHSDKSGLSIPLLISAPGNISLSDSTALSVAGGHIMHTVLDESANDPNGLQKRFAVYLEYKLHVWLRMGEDVFDEASGDLVNRKMDEMAYTIVCPLMQQDTQTEPNEGDEPVPVVPPIYDGVWEQPPPDYSRSTEHAPAQEHTTHS